MPDLTIDTGRKSLYYEKLTIDNTVGGVGFTSSKILGTASTFTPVRACQEAFCTLETGPVRFTLDGTAPTTTTGHLMNIGDTLTIRNAFDIQNFRAIRTTATSGELFVTYKY